MLCAKERSGSNEINTLISASNPKSMYLEMTCLKQRNTAFGLYYLSAEQGGYTNRNMPGKIRKCSKQISNREASVTVTDWANTTLQQEAERTFAQMLPVTV